MLSYKKVLAAGAALSAAALIAVPTATATAATHRSRAVTHAVVAAPRSYLGTSTRCFGVYPGKNVTYAPGCYGHDEPQVMPMSTVAGSASNITWTFVLGTDQAGATATTGMSFVDLGPTFWVGAALKDTKSLDDAAFEELQFYPDSVLAPVNQDGCTSGGGYSPSEKLNDWTVCSPAWAVNPSSFQEYAAFNKELTTATHPNNPMVMHSGDTISVSFAGSPYTITVTDLTTKQTGTIVMSGGGPNDADGPLGPLYPNGANVKTNSLPWGAVQDAPMGLSWEIGHPDFYIYTRAPECVPGQFNCFSYNVTQGWAKVTPFRILSVTFNKGKTDPTSWGVTDTQGGSAEDVEWCAKYAVVPSCTFPWYAYNSTLKALTFGTNYTGTKYAYNDELQFAATLGSCSSSFGFIYCNEPLSPAPPIK